MRWRVWISVASRVRVVVALGAFAAHGVEADARALGQRLGGEVHASAGDQEVDPATLDG